MCVPPIDNGSASASVISLTVRSLIVKSALAEPTFISNASDVSFHRIEALSEVPRLTSTPPFSLGAPVSFEFRTIVLSSMFTVSDRVVVTEPETVKSPFTTALPVTLNEARVEAPASSVFVPKSRLTPNVASVSSNVNTVADVPVSSIPVEAKFETVPPSIASPEIWSLATVRVPEDTSNVLPAPTVIS